MTVRSVSARQNHLFNSLSEADLAPYLSQLDMVEGQLKAVLFEGGKPIEYVYFPCSAVFSNLITMEDGNAIEVGTTGNESFTTVELLMGATTATETGICQIAGTSLCMSIGDFREAISKPSPLRNLLHRAGQAYLFMVLQTAACNRLHHVEGRFARWLLITHDRVKGNEFPLTQEFLAIMLGVQRPSVNLVAGAFQQAGMIQYRRGKMQILDRTILEETACECYGKVRARTVHLLGIPHG